MRSQFAQLAVFFRLTTFLFALLTIPASIAATAQAETIRFAPLPMENRETVVKQYRPMVLYLEKALNVTIEFVFTDNYADIINNFAKGQIDLAYLGPLPYVELRTKDDKAEPLVHFNEASGKPMYTCAIVTLADSPLKLQGLKNSRIGLTQPLSTCGYLSVNGLLQEQGSRLEDNRYTYLDKHDTVALAVVRGEYDAGGLKTAIGKKYSHMGLKIVAETAPMPSFGLVGNQATMSSTTMQNLREALTRLDPATADKEMLAAWGENIRYGAVAASDKDYDVVRKFKGNSAIPTTNKDK
jgi:phosphonate transport system substrate-binding protein